MRINALHQTSPRANIANDSTDGQVKILATPDVLLLTQQQVSYRSVTNWGSVAGVESRIRKMFDQASDEDSVRGGFQQSRKRTRAEAIPLNLGNQENFIQFNVNDGYEEHSLSSLYTFSTSADDAPTTSYKDAQSKFLNQLSLQRE